MSKYCLTDIHFHTNMSYDAYENVNNKIDYISFDKDEILKDSNVELLCVTDHNYFDYIKYRAFQNALPRIKILSAIEASISNVHWVIIFDDEKLAQNNIGETLTKSLMDMICLKTDDDLIKFQNVNFEAKKIIECLNELDINFIAIPHLDKDKGLLNGGIISQDNLEIINEYLYSNIIYGFEVKNHDQYFIKKIATINSKINEIYDVIKEQDKLNGLLSQLEVSENLKKMNLSTIHGSDYHGTKEGYKAFEDKLFYIKSAPTFEGLRFSLLDFNSRIFSKEKLEKYSKTSSKMIDKITFDINGTKKTIEFGDGLNSIIGSRGSGKSFIVNSIIGKNDAYKGSEIYNQIKLSKIETSNTKDSNVINLDVDVDFISQKNTAKSDDNDQINNFYNILADAPYDVDYFIDSIKQLNASNTSLKQIPDFFILLNDHVANIINLDKVKKTDFDYSFLNKYSEFKQTASDNYKISEIISKYILFANNLINNYIEDNKKIKLLETSIGDVENNLKNVMKIKNYKYVDNTLLFEEFKKIREANTAKISELKRLTQRLSNTKKLANILTSDISNQLSNDEKIYETRFVEFEARLSSVLDKMLTVKNSQKTIQEVFNNELVDKDEWAILKSNKIIKVSSIRRVNLNSITNKNFDDIFKNYLVKPKNVPFKEIFGDDFGEYFVKNIMNNKDGRKSIGLNQGHQLFEPSIEKDIYININGKEENLKKLSPGEKSDILLDLILDFDSNKILIIDQPEDDLDNETIFTKVVSKLREVKLNRQIIIVSHNANLVINCDSDKIIICEKREENSKQIYDVFDSTMEDREKHEYKSITTEIIDTVLNIAVHILDGGREALASRVRKIGYKNLFFNGGR